MSTKLFRPYLSFQEIERILSLLSPQEDAELYLKLFKLRTSISLGIQKESWNKLPSLEQKLGLAQVPKSPGFQPSELWAFLKSGNILSPSEILAAKTWAWSEDKMTPQEAEEFSSSQNL